MSRLTAKTRHSKITDMVKLSTYAKRRGVSLRKAQRLALAGKIPGSFKGDNGRWYVEGESEDEIRELRTRLARLEALILGDEHGQAAAQQG